MSSSRESKRTNFVKGECRLHHVQAKHLWELCTIPQCSRNYVLFRLQHLDGQQVANLLQSENAHQQEFLQLRTDWEQKGQEFDEQAKRKQADLATKHTLELHRLDQVHYQHILLLNNQS